MSIRLFAQLSTLCFALSGITANADTITTSLFTPPSIGPNPTLIDLSGIATPSQATIHGAGYTISFSTGVLYYQGVVQGNLSVVSPGGGLAAAHAVPVAGVTAGGTPEYLTGGFGSPLTTNIANSGNYLSTGTGAITITFDTPKQSLALLWGSVDMLNELSFYETVPITVTGAAIQAAAGFSGDYGVGSTWVLINTTTPFTTVLATNSMFSFEFAGISAAGPFVVPEPSSVALFSAAIPLLAFGALRRRGTRGTAGLYRVFRRCRSSRG